MAKVFSSSCAFVNIRAHTEKLKHLIRLMHINLLELFVDRSTRVSSTFHRDPQKCAEDDSLRNRKTEIFHS